MDFCQGVSDQAECLAGRLRQLRAIGGQTQPASVRFEQAQSKIGGEFGDAAADRTMRQSEFGSRGTHRAQSGHRLEGTQIVERRYCRTASLVTIISPVIVRSYGYSVSTVLLFITHMKQTPSLLVGIIADDLTSATDKQARRPFSRKAMRL